YVIIKDGVRGASTPINNGESITLNSTGNYQIEVTAVDNSGNTEVKTSGTYKIDTTPPVITFNDVTLKIDEVAGYNLMTGVTATDNSGVRPTLSYTGGLSAIIGTQTITYQATDEAGNVATRTRRFTITAATAPIISYSPIQTTGWVKAVNITISATVKIGENLSAFTYSINNGAVQNGTRNGNTGTANVTLNTTGTYTISASATGGYGNSKTEGSGTYYIDATVPTVGAIGGNTDNWTTSKTLTATLSDSHSGVVAYAWTTSSATPTSWVTVGATNNYAFSKNVTANGTYYLWAKDAVGNISAAKSVTVSKIDTTTPSITSSYTGTAYSMTEKTSIGVSTLYSVTFGGMGGSVTCKNGSTVITNLNTLAVGSHTLTCTATGNNGKTASVSPKVTIKSAGMSGSDLVNKDNLPNVAGANRYQGPDPNNFVTFNGEAYRIIGVFNGQMKIIYWGNYTTAGQFYRNTPMAWNSGNTNDWSQASLMTELNTTYWNTINSTYQNMVDQSHVWKLGGAYSFSAITRAQMYQYENGTAVYPGRPTTWTGKVALMYPSDYLYATSGGSTCDSTGISTWGENTSKIECAQKSWLCSSSQWQWTLTTNNKSSGSAFVVLPKGNIDYKTFSNSHVFYTESNHVRPVLFLTSDVKIKSGTGAATDPYILTK
ncbi:MAG: HYR domain-containing protein, partial [Bacilli bacterium]|nr:HYR domain-containing protein [Bacilli bacterium]